MKIQRSLIVAILVGAAAWHSAIARSATTEQSSDWQEAKSAFTPVNELRVDSPQAADAAKETTTMRVLGVSNGEDLTVFPPIGNGIVASSPAVSSQGSTLAVEPQVVGMTFRAGGANEELITNQKSTEKSQSKQESELVLLPAVESSIPSSTHLASNQTSGRISFASRAFVQEDQLGSSSPPTEQFLQDNAPTQWGPTVVASGCCDSACDSCCSNCCQSCCRPSIVVVGTEFVFVSPDINGVPVGYLFEDFGTSTSTLIGPSTDYAAMDDFIAAPRIWMGIQGPCWGVVARYYHLRAGENAHDLYVPQPFQTGDTGFNVDNILESYYVDVELTRNFCLHGCKNQLAFGVRYGALEHHESIYGWTDTTDGELMATARRNREAHGTGLTFGLNGRKPLFCNSCAHWFYSARGSVLWGPSASEVQTSATATASGGASVIAGTVEGASVVVNDDLFIAELQAGLQWDFALRCLPAKAFFRTAFEYQYWDASSGLAAAGSFAGFGSPDFQVTTNADAPGLIVDFIGLSIGTGFTW